MVAIQDPRVVYYLYSSDICDLLLLQEKGHLSWSPPQKKSDFKFT